MQLLFIVGVPCTRFYELYDGRRLSGMHVTLRSITSYLELLLCTAVLLLPRYGKLYIHTIMLKAKSEHVWTPSEHLHPVMTEGGKLSNRFEWEHPLQGPKRALVTATCMTFFGISERGAKASEHPSSQGKSCLLHYLLYSILFDGPVWSANSRPWRTHLAWAKRASGVTSEIHLETAGCVGRSPTMLTSTSASRACPVSSHGHDGQKPLLLSGCLLLGCATSKFHPLFMINISKLSLTNFKHKTNAYTAVVLLLIVCSFRVSVWDDRSLQVPPEKSGQLTNPLESKWSRGP